MKLFEKKQINPNWILSGEGGKYLMPTDAQPNSYVVRVTEIRPPMECSVQELFAEMVRRVSQKPENAAIQKSWHPVKKTEGEA